MSINFIYNADYLNPDMVSGNFFSDIDNFFLDIDNLLGPCVEEGSMLKETSSRKRSFQAIDKTSQGILNPETEEEPQHKKRKLQKPLKSAEEELNQPLKLNEVNKPEGYDLQFFQEKISGRSALAYQKRIWERDKKINEQSNLEMKANLEMKDNSEMQEFFKKSLINLEKAPKNTKTAFNKWDKEKSVALLTLKNAGNSYPFIAKILNKKTQECYRHFHLLERLSRSLNLGCWSDDEIGRFFQCEQAITEGNWEEVAHVVKTRDTVQCSKFWNDVRAGKSKIDDQKYHAIKARILESKKSRSPRKWNDKMRQKLIELVEEKGTDWDEIATAFPGKTPQNCYSQWTSSKNFLSFLKKSKKSKDLILGPHL